MANETKKPISAAETRHKVLTIVGIVLCALLLPILIINCIMIVQSLVNEDKVPGVAGFSPLIVLTDSMYDTIYSGDIIIVQAIEGEDVAKDHIISFFDPAGNGTSVVTHRVIDIKTEDGVLKFQTQGDNNNTPDRIWVSEDNLVGRWTGFRLPGFGHVALFMQSTWGLVVCVVVPLALLIGYDVLRRKKEDEGKKEDVAALMKELEALKAAQAAGNTQPSSVNEVAPETSKEDTPSDG